MVAFCGYKAREDERARGGRKKTKPGEPRERRLERQKQWGALANQHRSANLVSGCATPFPLRTDIIQRREESHEQTFVPLFLLKETEEAKEKEPRGTEKRAKPGGKGERRQREWATEKGKTRKKPGGKNWRKKGQNRGVREREREREETNPKRDWHK